MFYFTSQEEEEESTEEEQQLKPSPDADAVMLFTKPVGTTGESCNMFKKKHCCVKLYNADYEIYCYSSVCQS